VEPRGVALGAPVGDQRAGMGQMALQRLVQDLVPHPAVEAFDAEQANAIAPREPATVLHRLARRDGGPFDPLPGAPLQDRVRGQFRPPTPVSPDQ
jgi:hypothetical protein